MITAQEAKKLKEESKVNNIDEDLKKVYYEIEKTSKDGRDITSWYNLSDEEIRRLTEIGYDVEFDDFTFDKESKRYTISW